MRTSLVVGGSSGIGLETARALAKANHKVILTSPNLARAKKAAQEIGGDSTGEALNLLSMQSVREFADDFLAQHDKLDVLIHNAGLVLPKRQMTEDGLESTLSVTYLGPFYLTYLLEPLVQSAPQTRIINVASDLHHQAKLDFNDLHSQKSYQFIKVFAKAELAKILWTRELASRLAVEKATVNSLHPGGVKTDLFRHFTGPMKALLWLSNLLKMSPAKGAKTSIHLALSDELKDVTGEYFIKCKKRQVSKLASDPELSLKLWKKTHEILGIEEK